VGHHFVELIDVECDESSHCRLAVERIQIEPVIFQSTPPDLNGRIRFNYLNLRQDPFQNPAEQKLVDSIIDVFDTAIGEQGNWGLHF
jgi:hypothetical protein